MWFLAVDALVCEQFTEFARSKITNQVKASKQKPTTFSETDLSEGSLNTLKPAQQRQYKILKAISCGLDVILALESELFCTPLSLLVRACKRPQNRRLVALFATT